VSVRRGSILKVSYFFENSKEFTDPINASGCPLFTI
jgi:hypothetical protein